MGRKNILTALSARYKQSNDEIEAEILRTEERLTMLKSLLAERKEEETEIGAISAEIS